MPLVINPAWGRRIGGYRYILRCVAWLQASTCESQGCNPVGRVCCGRRRGWGGSMFCRTKLLCLMQDQSDELNVRARTPPPYTVSVESRRCQVQISARNASSLKTVGGQLLPVPDVERQRSSAVWDPPPQVGLLVRGEKENNSTNVLILDRLVLRYNSNQEIN